MVNTYAKYAKAQNLVDVETVATPVPVRDADDVTEPMIIDLVENDEVCEAMETDGLLLGKRMLRSGYMEKSAGAEWNGGRKRTCSSENSDSSQEVTGGDSGEGETCTACNKHVHVHNSVRVCTVKVEC